MGGGKISDEDGAVAAVVASIIKLCSCEYYMPTWRGEATLRCTAWQ